MRVFWIPVLALMLVQEVQARPLTEEEQSSLNRTRDRFIEALNDADYEAVVEVMPPRIISHIARAGGVPEPKLREQMPRLMASVFAKVEIHEMEMRTEGIDVTDSRGPNDVSYVWGFAPTSVSMSADGEKLVVKGHTLALREGGTWYLVRTNDVEQVALLRTAYPFLKNVSFPGTDKEAADQ